MYDDVRAGEVKLEYRHWSMTERPAGVASYGAVAAGLQAQQWQFIELFFHNQDEATSRGVTQEFLDEVAKGVLNLNVEQWQNDFDEPEVKETLEDEALAIDVSWNTRKSWTSCGSAEATSSTWRATSSGSATRP